MIPSTWTYDPALATNRDKVRFLIGDTDDKNKQFDDGEIDGIISLETNIYYAAAAMADTLAMRSARGGAIVVDGLSVTDQTQRYRELAASLRARALQSAGGLGQPFVGGISQGEMNSVDQDSDRTPSQFRIRQNEFVREDQLVERQLRQE